MGHGLDTPLLQDHTVQHAYPSAPPMAHGGAYPQIPSPGADPFIQQHPGHAMGFPAAPMQHQPPGVPVMHPSQAPAPAVVEHHFITRIQAEPQLHTCPACGSSGPTLVRRENGLCAWLLAFVTCWVCCPCFWLPFCLDCDKDLVHRCSVCGTEIHRVKPCS